VKHLALILALTLTLHAQAPVAPPTAAPQLIAPGVWFLLGDSSKGYANTIVIEMRDYLIVVDANYPGRAKELLQIIPTLSPKPIKYVFDTHAHGDHAYGNSTWTAAGATTLAYIGVVKDMDRYEPERWHIAEQKRQDVRDLHQPGPEYPKQTFSGSRFILRSSQPASRAEGGCPIHRASCDEWDIVAKRRPAAAVVSASASEPPAVRAAPGVNEPLSTKDQAIINSRTVEFLHFGWAHTQGDAFVWLPHERILCTGDAAANGPRNKLWDADIANWPRVLSRTIALHPEHVLPGHGPAGGIEILRGQRQYLIDLRSAVAQQMKLGRTPANIVLNLPASDQNWIRKDPTDAIEPTYNELKAHQPAGALPHTWR
jgi:glyoxylase-like metal-dependent hydrolase (beta-lactamase superfamily II)